jgi:hypothetical protein
LIAALLIAGCGGRRASLGGVDGGRAGNSGAAGAGDGGLSNAAGADGAGDAPDGGTCDDASACGASCVALGYGSGVLACGAGCAQDTTACDECTPLAGALVGCRADVDDPGEVYRGDFPSLAATNSAVAMVWRRPIPEGQAKLTFTLLSPDLTVVNQQDVGGTAVAPLNHRQVMGTAVAPLPSGWVVAVAGEPEVFALALDPSGEDAGRVTLETVEGDHFDYATTMTLVPRPDGGPLAIWTAVQSIRVAVVAADGLSATAPVELPFDKGGGLSGPSGAYVGGAFYVVYSAFSAVPAERSVRLVRIDVDGHVSKVADLLPGEPTAQVSLAAGTNDLRLSYVGTGSASADGPVLWRRLGLDGATLAGPTTLGAFPPAFERASPLVATGDHTVVLVPGRDRLSLGIARISPTGAIAEPVQTFARTPNELRKYGLVRRGAEAVAFWHVPSSAGGRIGVAHLKL